MSRLGKLNTTTATVENLEAVISTLDTSDLPAELRDATKDVLSDKQFYYDDDAPEIVEMVDWYVKELNKHLSKSQKNNKGGSGSKKKPATKPSTKKAVKIREGDPVADVDLEVRIIKRFILLDNKKKTRDQVLAFFNSLKRAILTKKIRKTSKYATEIKHIQKSLEEIYNGMVKNNSSTVLLQLSKTDKRVLEAYGKIAKSQYKRTSVLLLSRYIGIHGKSNVKEKATALLKAIKNAEKANKIPDNDPYKEELNKAKASITTYIGEHSSALRISTADLKGLQGIPGLKCPFQSGEGSKDASPKSKNIEDQDNHKLSGIEQAPEIISSTELSNMDLRTMGFTGKWLSLIGDPSSPFLLMFWAKPGMGKSTLAIELAKYMATDFNKKVLFASIEEGFNFTTKEKFERLDAIHPNISITKELPGDLSQFDVVAIDSITRAKLTTDEFIAIKNQNPQITFILIFQATVDGNYRGSKEWEHEVDVSVYINENGYATASKSRFGGQGTVKVFQGTVDKIYKFTNLQEAEKFMSNQKERMGMVQGSDGKIWVTNPDKAKELAKQGYSQF